MILVRWLDSRRPLPPAALRARIDAALGRDLLADVDDVAEAMLAAGERLVGTLLVEDATSRGSALDLLAADALVTYAFEAASERPTELSGRAAEAMARIAALGATPGRRTA
ncbi:MAG TPA: hypothetical protein VJT85_05590 [Gemmatimonadaceae bacterium]|nr:hypothetical protein [Gemmatimonadaceae bacterium]